MARSRGKPAAEVDFSDCEQAQEWFERQPPEVCIALAMRSALRVLPLIEAVRSIPDFAPRVALPVLRACFVAWAIAEYPSRHDHLRIRRATLPPPSMPPADCRYADATCAAAPDAAVQRCLRRYARRHYAVAAATPPSRRYAATTAHAAAAVRADAVAIEQGRAVAEIVAAPLWPGEIPERIAEAWDRLRTWMLEDEANNWDPWVQWYERVRDGRPSFGEAFDLAVASLTDEQWNEEPVPAAVNRRIAALLAEHTGPSRSPQGPGPIRPRPDLRIALGPAQNSTREGKTSPASVNSCPSQRIATPTLREHLPGGAVQAQSRTVAASSRSRNELPGSTSVRNLRPIRAAIEGEPRDNRLESCADPVEIRLQGRLLPRA